jgi:hypothetical protein
MKVLSKESLGDLAKGIKQLLLEDRCSFSDEDQVLLRDCLEVVENLLYDPKQREIDLYDVSRIVELIFHFFLIAHHA